MLPHNSGKCFENKSFKGPDKSERSTKALMIRSLTKPRTMQPRDTAITRPSDRIHWEISFARRTCYK